MGEQSLLDEMRAALRGDFERARERRERGPEEEPQTAPQQVRPALDSLETKQRATPVEPPISEPDSGARSGRLARLFRR